MRKLIITLLCILFVVLCACGPTEPLEELTVATQITIETTSEPANVSAPTVTIKTDKDDPLSFVVEEYLELYNELLNDENRFMEPHYYFLYDIDGNGTKELLLGEEWEDQIYFYSVHTIQNGVAVHQKEFRDISEYGPPAMLFMNGTIRTVDDDGGRKNYFYYRFEGKELKFQTILLDLSDSGSGYKRMDERFGEPRSITGAEFRRVQKEFEGDGQVVELDWKPLAEYGR